MQIIRVWFTTIGYADFPGIPALRCLLLLWSGTCHLGPSGGDSVVVLGGGRVVTMLQLGACDLILEVPTSALLLS